MKIVRNRSSSLETKFNLKSDNMGIVSMAYNPEKHLLATNSINGDICFFSTETGILLLTFCYSRYGCQNHCVRSHASLAYPILLGCEYI